jgi:hypothetical protein
VRGQKQYSNQRPPKGRKKVAVVLERRREMPYWWRVRVALFCTCRVWFLYFHSSTHPTISIQTRGYFVTCMNANNPLHAPRPSFYLNQPPSLSFSRCPNPSPKHMHNILDGYFVCVCLRSKRLPLSPVSKEILISPHTQQTHGLDAKHCYSLFFWTFGGGVGRQGRREGEQLLGVFFVWVVQKGGVVSGIGTGGAKTGEKHGVLRGRGQRDEIFGFL